MGYVQQNLKIEDVIIPVITKDSEMYFPISFIEKQLLLRDKGSFLSGIKKEDRFKLIVDYSKWGGGIQEVNCVREEILVERLCKTRQRWLSIGQIKSQNKLHRFLKIEELDEEQFEWDYYNLEWCKEYDDSLRVLIINVVGIDSEIKARRCRDCSKILPLIDGFFYKESKADSYAYNCALCKNKGMTKRYSVPMILENLSEYERYLFNMNQENLIEHYRNRKYIEIYKLYYEGVLNKLPDDIYNEIYLKEIITYLISIKEIDTTNLTESVLKDEFRIHVKNFGMSITEVYQWLYGEEFYLDKWKYPRYMFRNDIKLTLELGLTIFQRYLDQFKISIEDPFNFDYDQIIKKCTISGLYLKEIGGVCDFFVAYWKGKYAGYQFRNIGNYYKFNEQNFLSDLRHLVEKDLKLPIEKIPLYVTRGLLTKEYKTIYNHIRSTKKSLFYYFDKLYPDRFVEADFFIGKYRNEFDSIEEQQVDGVLREYFSNVVYNYKGDNRVVLKGKEPDWMIFTEKGVWIVEYFGMYLEKHAYNPIVSDYIKTTKEKIELYNGMEGYNFVLVYPNDIENGFLGLRDKLREIKDKYRVS